MTEGNDGFEALYAAARHLAASDPSEWPIWAVDEMVFDGREAAVAMLSRALVQLLKRRGASADAPLRGLGIEGYYLLARTIGLELRLQTMHRQPGGAILDEMSVSMPGSAEFTVYNLVKG